jgi:hypothetical protein
MGIVLYYCSSEAVIEIFHFPLERRHKACFSYETFHLTKVESVCFSDLVRPACPSWFSLISEKNKKNILACTTCYRKEDHPLSKS